MLWRTKKLRVAGTARWRLRADEHPEKASWCFEELRDPG
jgi:hypothetical protein